MKSSSCRLIKWGQYSLINHMQKTLCCFILESLVPRNPEYSKPGGKAEWEPETNATHVRQGGEWSHNPPSFPHKHFDSGLRWVPFLNANILVRIFLYVCLFHRARIRFHWHAYLHGISISVVKKNLRTTRTAVILTSSLVFWSFFSYIKVVLFLLSF